MSINVCGSNVGLDTKKLAYNGGSQSISALGNVLDPISAANLEKARQIAEKNAAKNKALVAEKNHFNNLYDGVKKEVEAGRVALSKRLKAYKAGKAEKIHFNNLYNGVKKEAEAGRVALSERLKAYKAGKAAAANASKPVAANASKPATKGIFDSVKDFFTKGSGKNILGFLKKHKVGATIAAAATITTYFAVRGSNKQRNFIYNIQNKR